MIKVNLSEKEIIALDCLRYTLFESDGNTTEVNALRKIQNAYENYNKSDRNKEIDKIVTITAKQFSSIQKAYELIEDFIDFVTKTSIEIPVNNIEEIASTLNYILDNSEDVKQ